MQVDTQVDTTELILLGTGTSASVPSVACLTDPAATCRACLATLTPQGKRNIRRNTSAAFRLNSRKGVSRKVTIIVDVGKNFQAAAVDLLEHFRPRNLRTIDAVIITHGHADAMNGLDDLRAWTTGSDRIQDHVDIYLTLQTFNEVKWRFPYMVHKEYATGGGDTPDFKWHIIEDKIPFEIADTGIFFTPFLVQHGWIFVPPPVPPTALDPTTASDLPTPMEVEPTNADKKTPFMCLGLKLDDIAYMADVSRIPDDVWPIILEPRLSVCVLDCLHLRHHPSHFSLDESIEAARKINARRTYLTGFSHRISHEEYVSISEMVGGGSLDAALVPMTETLEKIRDTLSATRAEPIWMRPAFDGLQVLVKDALVEDDGYMY